MATMASRVSLNDLQMATPLSLSSLVRPAKDVLCCELRGEAVILNLKTGVYYGLDSVGARIWELIKEPISIGDVCERLLDEYKVSQEQCELEVCDLFEQLTELGLVELEK